MKDLKVLAEETAKYLFRSFARMVEFEDLCQECYLAFLELEATGPQLQGLKEGYYHRTAVHRAIRRVGEPLKRAMRIRREFSDVVTEPLSADFVVFWGEICAVLSAKQTQALALNVLCGLTITEIAQDQKIPRHRVLGRYQSAIKTARRRLNIDGKRQKTLGLESSELRVYGPHRIPGQKGYIVRWHRGHEADTYKCFSSRNAAFDFKTAMLEQEG